MKLFSTLALVFSFHIHSALADGFLVDRNGEIVRNFQGECWRTKDTDPKLECPPLKDAIHQTKAAPQQKTDAQSKTIEVFFAPGKADLQKSDRQKIEAAFAEKSSAQSFPKKITIQGFADLVGQSNDNMTLSQSRADAVLKQIQRLKSSNQAVLSSQALGDLESKKTNGHCLNQADRDVCLAGDRKVVIVLE